MLLLLLLLLLLPLIITCQSSLQCYKRIGWWLQLCRHIQTIDIFT